MARLDLLLCAAVSLLIAIANAHAADGAWAILREDLFAGRPIIEDGDALRVSAPKRADDAALVPVTITIAAGLALRARRLTLVIDENPSPVAAVVRFEKGYREGANAGDRTIETRVRLNDMSPVRAILETDGGDLYGASQFVSGAGGCTSTSLKDIDAALASLGRTRLRVGTDATRGRAWRDLLIQVRHPNFSGMQIDTKTNKYLPAHFVERIDLAIDAEPLLSIESGMSISENPSFRLSFAREGRFVVDATVRDTKGSLFSARSGS